MGLVGSHLTESPLARRDSAIALDCVAAYHDPALKRRNLAPIARSGDVERGSVWSISGVEEITIADLIELAWHHEPRARS